MKTAKSISDPYTFDNGQIIGMQSDNHGDTAQAPVSWASGLNCDYPFLLSIIRNVAMSAATTAAAAQATTSTLLSSASSTTIGGNGT